MSRRPWRNATDAELEAVLSDWRRHHHERALHSRRADEARREFARAVRDGRLVRPGHCSRCGVTGRIEGHHEDYSHPLEVIWLCRTCHRSADRARRARESRGRAAPRTGDVSAVVTEQIYRSVARRSVA